MTLIIPTAFGPGIIADVCALSRLHSEFLRDKRERFMAGLYPWSVFTRDNGGLEQIVKGDASNPLPLHSRCPVAVRDQTQLVPGSFQPAHCRLRVSEGRTVRRVDPPVLKRQF